MPDMIVLKGIRAMGVHGVFPEEQVDPQPFEIDLEVASDLRRAASTDKLADTISYCDLAESAASIVTSNSFALVEKLAEAIADQLLSDQRIQSVAVAVRKVNAKMPVEVGSVEVRVTRP